MEATLERFEEEESAKQEALETSAAIAEREASQHAYEGLTPGEAEDLLRSTFSEALASLNGDPSRWLTDAKLDRPLGETAAEVTKEGKTSLYEGTLPVQAENEEGEAEKVDLELEKTDEGWAPRNPLVEVSIGETAEDGVELSGSGEPSPQEEDEAVTITQVGAEEAAARPFGDKNLFFGEVEAGSDTDLLVSPVSQGAEMFDILRSAASPETLRFHVTMPEGAELRAVGGGAEVISAQGSNIALVPPPHAVDAQGATVPVSLEVQGDLIVVQVERGQQEVAYPLLVDPAVYQDWGWWYEHRQPQINGIWAWGWNEYQSGWLFHGYEDTGFPGWGGLFMSSAPGGLPAGQWGQWYYSAPNAGTYLANAVINPFWRNNRNCSAPNPYPEPYDYDGMWNETSWNRIVYNQANSQGWSQIESWGRAFVIGMGTSNGTSIPCWRDIGIGGVGIWLEDWQYPTVSAPSGVPSGWVNESTHFTISASAEDAGLGVAAITISPQGSEPILHRPSTGNPAQACFGTWEHPCPNQWSSAFELTAARFDQGETTEQLSAEDPTLKGSNTEKFTMKVDRTAPELSLAGQLETAVQEAGAGEHQGEGGPELKQPVYNLKVEATDGKITADPKTKRSGTKKVEILLDGALKETFTNPSCPESSCVLNATYPVKLTGLAAGKHTLEVRATDFAENAPAKREIEFEYEPATGISEEFVLQRFPLPDGQNHEAEEVNHGPEVAVNVMNGNVVYHQRDVNVEGPDADLEVELFYNSQLPKEQSSEWGRGWTLSQTPRLVKTSGGSGFDQGTALTSEAAMTSVDLPQETGQQRFSTKLNAVVTKEAAGGYSVSEEGGQEGKTTLFNAAGQTTEVQSGPYASVDYAYESGKLSEIAVDDPAATTEPPPPVKPAPPVHLTFVSAFGSTGSGNGQLNGPRGVAADGKGHVWVVDRANNRVEEFTEAGEYLGKFGSLGSGNGQFNNPWGIAVTAAGNLWVTDTGNQRVEEFNSKGEFVQKFGAKASGESKGTEFLQPEGIAVTPGGMLWVTDSAGNRVGEFRETVSSESERFLRNATGTSFKLPVGVAVDASGNVWVGEESANHLLEFSPTGTFIRSVGSTGSGNGQLNVPEGVGISPAGDIYVVDLGNNRIDVFNPQGQFLTKFGTAGTGNANFSEPRAIAFGASGALFISDKGNNRIHKWGSAWEGPPTFVSAFGSTGSGNGQLNGPRGVVADGKGHVWVVDRANNRVEEFNESGKYLGQFGSTGSGNGQFSNPWGIAVTAAGNLWVTDTGNQRVQEFNSNGEFIQKFGTKATSGSKGTELLEPEGIAVAPGGMLWVADCAGNRVAEFRETVSSESERFVRNATGTSFKLPVGVAIDLSGNLWVGEESANHLLEFSSEGTFVRSVGSTGSGNGQLSTPAGVGVGPSGNVYVVDLGNNRVDVFTPSGQFLTKFGTTGTGDGNFSEPRAIAFGASGAIFVSDKGNNRIGRWGTAGEGPPIFDSAFGTTGSGPGQLNGPRGVASDGDGHVWVVDRANNRVEEFNESGEYLGQFGSFGSGNGQFKEPWGIAVSPDGNLWVADTENQRVEEFNSKGEFLQKFGTKATSGSKGTEFLEPEGIAIAPGGMIWVSDNSGARIAEFRESVASESERFVRNVATTGTGNPGLARPLGLAVDSAGDLWAADETANRVIEYSAEGEFLRTFGSTGFANGQLNSPKGLGIGPLGNIYVVDWGNNRVEVFNPEAEFLTKFGTAGAGNGNFSEPRAIAFGASGAIFVSDKGNNRVHKWGLPGARIPGVEEAVPVEDDPAVDLHTTSGLISSLEGPQAGQHAYGHEGELLSADAGPDGTTAYQYDGSGRLTKVTLPNGTTAEVKYDSIGRATKVTVDPAGSEPAKATNFTYAEEAGTEARETIVEPEGARRTFYAIGGDGSVLRWQNAEAPPSFRDKAGSIWELQEKELEPGGQTLLIEGESAEGIAKIQFIANGNTVVDEKTCATSRKECEREHLEWVTSTEELSPGIMYIEAVLTDWTGNSASKRWWVNVPYVPPLPPGEPHPPRFAEVLRFREEFGLDRDLNPIANELEIHDRIFDLLGAWHNPQTPLGEVARASWERWGVPMRPVDVAELEYREWFYNLDAARIDQWVEETQPANFAGYYLDHAAGGIMYIGFLGNQTEQLASLRAALSLVGGERLHVYPTAPTASLRSVQETSEAVSSAMDSNPTLAELVVNVEFDESGRVVRVGTPNVAQVESILKQMLGSSAPVQVEYKTPDGRLLSGRFRNEGRMRAGDAIFTRHYTAEGVHDGNEMCTAGFGAKDRAGEVAGQAVWRLFVLTAGHCSYHSGAIKTVYRSTDSDSRDEDNWVEVGEMTRTGFHQPGPIDTDAEAIRVESDGIVPQGIFGSGGGVEPTQPATTVKKNSTVCFSGARSQNPISCGQVVGRALDWSGAPDGVPRSGYWVHFNPPAQEGDSGAPVYSIFGPSVGLISADRYNGAETYVVPLLTPPGLNSTKVPGILNDPHLRPLSLKLGD